MHNRDDDLLLAPRLEELAAAASSSTLTTAAVITDSESDSQVPCWRGAKACFCTLRRYLLVAICDILIITVLCVTLVEPRWLVIRQGQCRINGREGRYIGVDFFFSRGLYAENPQEIVFRYGENNELVNCLNAAAVTIFRCAVTLLICCICLTLVSFFFCIVKLRVQLFLVIRKYAVFNIVTAIICAAVLILVFCASDEVNNIQQRSNRNHKPPEGTGSYVPLINSDYLPSDPYAITDFSTGYYLILLAAFLSLLAVGITLIDCACYHQVFASSRHSTRGYERLISASSAVSLPPEQIPANGSNSGSAQVSNRRTIFAVPVPSSSRNSRPTFTTISEHPVSSSGLLPPPPPYSATPNQHSNNNNASGNVSNSATSDMRSSQSASLLADSSSVVPTPSHAADM